MTEINFKRSLFGYTKSSVYNYITELNREFSRKMEEVSAANQELTQRCSELESEAEQTGSKETELLDEISKYIREQDQLRAELEEQKQVNEELRERLSSSEKEADRIKAALGQRDTELSELRSINSTYVSAQNDIADVIIDAKHFANSLKRKAEQEYEQKTAQNTAKLTAEANRISGYISSLDELCGTVRKLCDQFGSDIEKKKEQLEELRSEMDSGEA